MSRDASIRLAEEIQDLAKDRGFKKETGGMFNRGDLMKITQESGRSGLMDESQDIEGVKKNIKNVSRTLRKYMQLTQDPDMVNVLRELGQMKQFGMTLDDMEQAASSMNRYSKAAGTSIAGIKQMGMMGAGTFQQAGLTGGSGMRYGMHAAAAARQGIATGGFQPREIALMGGMQGMVQRNVQAQAAMMSMPMFGASVGQYGAQGFGLNQGALQGMGQGGAQGMVRGAVSNMNQAVQRGGIGALAMFPLQQRRLQTEAAESMTPEQAMAMRFQMSLRTGQQLGLQGAGAFAAGARTMFGNEVAEQMTMEAGNPQFFQAQRNRIQEQRQRLVRSQREANEAARPGAGTLIGRGVWRGVGGEYLEAGGAAVGSVASQAGGAIAGAFRGAGQALQDIQGEAEGRFTTRIGERFVSGGAQERRNVYGQDASVLSQRGFQRGMTGSDYGGRTVSRALDYGDMAPTGMASDIGGFLAKVSMPLEGAITQALGFGDVPAAGVEALIGTGAGLAMGPEATNRLVQQQVQQAHQYTQMAKFAATKAGTKTGFQEAYDVLQKSVKGKANSGAAMSKAAGKISKLVKDKQNIILPDGTIDPTEVKKALRESLAEDGMSKSEIDKTLKDLEASGGLSKVGGVILNQAKKVAGPEYATQFDQSIEDAQKLKMGAVQDTQEGIMDRKEALLKSVENQLDLTYDIGGVAFGDKDGAEEFRGMLTEGPGATLVKAAAAMVGEEGEGEAREAAFKEYMALQGKGRSEAEVRKEFETAVAVQMQKPMSGDVKERFREAATGGEGGNVSQSMRKLTQVSAMTIQSKQYGDAMGGLETIMKGAGGEASGKLLKMATEGEITGAGIAEAFGKQDIRALARSGQRGLAGKIARFQKETDPEKKKQLEQEIMEATGELGEAKKKRETEMGEAEGKEAEDLEKSEEALAGVQGEMAQAFKDFRPAVETFSKGANALERAMESDMFKRMTEE
jgi:hypothetical protein